MSVTREDRQKNFCSSRGLGVAATAIGVGVGAALYYFFNKRTEHPNTEGSTSDWNCERPQPFPVSLSSDDSYTTMSEHETTDTSMNDETQMDDDSLNESTEYEVVTSDSEDEEEESDDDFSSTISNISSGSDYDIREFDVTSSSLGVPDDARPRSPKRFLVTRVRWTWGSPIFRLIWRRFERIELTEEQQMAMIREEPFPVSLSSDDSYTTMSEHETTDTSMNDETQMDDDSLNESTEYEVVTSDSEDEEEESDDDFSSTISNISSGSDYDIREFDVTSSSLGVPDDARPRSPKRFLVNRVRWTWGSPIFRLIWRRYDRIEYVEEQQMEMIREEPCRERSWTLEDCSICFDEMLRNQDVTQLPCAHNFHTECILPWLQEKQTCPMCRKNAE